MIRDKWSWLSTMTNGRKIAMRLVASETVFGDCYFEGDTGWLDEKSANRV